MKIHLETTIGELSEFYLQTLVLLYCPCEIFGKNDRSVSSLHVRAAYRDDGGLEVFVRLSDRGKTEEAAMTQNNCERFPDGIVPAKVIVGRAFCKCAQAIYGYTAPFGIMTGIRPAKLGLSYLEKGYTVADTRRIFTDIYGLQNEKADAVLSVAARERSLLHTLPKNSYSLYISIPFCPTRCSYCSFVSYATPRLLSMIPEYLERLCDDLRFLAAVTKELGLELYAVYVGGGTPSILSAEQIKRLLDTVYSSFPTGTCREFTFEAGRPDTVTREKLETLKSFGVDRVSINTQTANDDVLRTIGRRHTFSEYLESVAMARDVGFSCVNTDLIAGLPTESEESFSHSVQSVLEQNVGNITIHSLTLKKSSALKENGDLELLRHGAVVQRMLSDANRALSEREYFPYYMYRQKNTVGNLENTGYSLAGKECLYNICMMEEFHSVFAAGAGAVTKLVAPDRQTIARLFSQKYPYEYLRKTDERLDRDAILKFYREHF